MPRRRLLLLVPSASYRAEDFLAAARRMDIDLVTAVDAHQALPSDGPTGILELDFSDVPAAASLIGAYAARHPLDGILSVDDDGLVLAASACAALGLPSVPVSATRASRDKHLQRTLLADAGVRIPTFARVRIGPGRPRGGSPVGYPCVLKPLALAGSRGVIRADDDASFARAFERLAAILATPDAAARSGSAADSILVEAFVPGVEVALEGLLTDGALTTLALFDKPDLLDGPFFEETLYVTPSRLPAADQVAIAECAAAAAAALGLSRGPVHAELRLNDEGPWIIELSGRSIGGRCSRTLRFGAGLSLEDLILRHALGLETEGEGREAGAAGVMMLPIDAAGTLHSVDGVDAARAVPGVEEVTISLRPGQAVVPLPEGSRYLGFILARAPTPEAVEAALRDSAGRLVVRVD